MVRAVQIHYILKEIYEFDDKHVKPVKAIWSHWITHLLKSMSGLVDKFRLYLQHFGNVIADTSKKTDNGTLEGKRRLLTDSNVSLRCDLFMGLLNLARKFSWVSQLWHHLNGRSTG